VLKALDAVDVDSLFAFLTNDTALVHTLPGLPRGFPLRARAAAEEAAVAKTVVATPAATRGSASGSSQPYRVGLNPFGLIDQFAMLPSEELDQVYNTSCLPFH
jgi:hypothetical protein